MIEKIIVHLGVHKTATTYMQTSLQSDFDSLIDNDVLYVPMKTFRVRVTDKLKHSNLPHKIIQNGLAPLTRAYPNAKTLIISDENLLGSVSVFGKSSYGNFYWKLKAVMEAFPGISNVEVLICIRNICDFLPSIYSEFLRNFYFVPFWFYSKEIDIRSFRWSDLFLQQIQDLNEVDFYVVDFGNFKQSKNKIACILSDNVLKEFSEPHAKTGMVTRGTFSKRTIRIMSLFPVFTRIISKAFDKYKEKSSAPFSPFSNRQKQQAGLNLEQDIITISRLPNVTNVT